MRDMQGHYETRTEAAHYAQLDEDELIGGLVEAKVERYTRCPDRFSEWIGDVMPDEGQPLTDAQIERAIDHPLGANVGHLLVALVNRPAMNPLQLVAIAHRIAEAHEAHWRDVAESEVAQEMQRDAENAQADFEASWAD